MSTSTAKTIRSGNRSFQALLFGLALCIGTGGLLAEYDDLSPVIQKTLDAYSGGNPFIDSADSVESIRGGFDFRNLSGAASAVYEAKDAINRSIDARSFDEHLPGPRYGYRGQCGPTYGFGSPHGRRLIFPGRTELWGSFLYNNARGFGLNTRSFQYGYTNDLYGFTFGLDKTNGGQRIGIMGTAGWSNLRSYGDVIDTNNDTGFGGVYAYLNERFGEANLFFHAGWLGMTSDITQNHDDKQLWGRMNNGLFSIAATLSQLFCVDGLHITPSVGIEYGRYYQTSMDVRWSDELAFRNFASGADLLTIPVGVRFSREMTLQNGTLRPEIRLRYIANVADVASHYNTWLAGSSVPAPMVASMVDRHVGDIGVGASWTEGMTTIGLNYGFLFSKKRQSQIISLTGLWKF